LSRVKFLSKICFFAALLAIDFLAFTQKSPTIIENSWDKANHFLAFFVLYILLYFGYEFKIFKNLALLLAFGVQIELVQAFLPNRGFSLLDVVADMIGAAFGLTIVEILKRIIYGKSKASF
jgi:vanZ family protein